MKKKNELMDDEIIEDEELEEDSEDDEELEEDSEDEELEDEEIDNSNREISFHNKNEVYEDFFDERPKSIITIVIGIIFIIILIITCCILVYMHKDSLFKNIGNIFDNKDNTYDKSTFVDENSTMSDEISTNSDDVNNIINIYQSNSNESVAFKYDCKSEKCNIIVTKTGFVLYDSGKVWYRDMNAYEMEQINDTEKTPAGSALNFKGFKEFLPLSSTLEQTNLEILDYLYDINDGVYIVENDNIFDLKTYNNNLNVKYKSVAKIDNLLLFDGDIYDYANNNVIDENNGSSYKILDYKKEGNYYLFLIDTDDVEPYYMFIDSSYNVNYFTNYGYYIGSDKLYYIEHTEDEISILNNKGEKISDDLTPIYIFGNKILYLNDDNILCTKELLGDKVIHESTFKLDNKNYLPVVIGNSSEIELYFEDYTLIEKQEFVDKFDNNTIQMVNECISDSSSCEYFHIGYKLKIDKDGKISSFEYYMDVEQ